MPPSSTPFHFLFAVLLAVGYAVDQTCLVDAVGAEWTGKFADMGISFGADCARGGGECLDTNAGSCGFVDTSVKCPGPKWIQCCKSAKEGSTAGQRPPQEAFQLVPPSQSFTSARQMPRYYQRTNYAGRQSGGMPQPGAVWGNGRRVVYYRPQQRRTTLQHMVVQV